MAERYLRISSAGLVPALVALAGQGYPRGIGDLRTPLIIVVAALPGPRRSRAPRLVLLAPLLRICGEPFVRSAALLVAFATASARSRRRGHCAGPSGAPATLPGR